MSDDEGKIHSFTARRFARFGSPEAHDPMTALQVAAEWIEAQENRPDHVIVLIGRTTGDNSSGTKYFQAGKYPHHAQMGLLVEGGNMIRESGR